jgi:hypothetical protein
MALAFWSRCLCYGCSATSAAACCYWSPPMRPDTPAYLLAAAAALWGVVGLGAETDFKYFYLLFLPIIWAAARQGLAGRGAERGR